MDARPLEEARVIIALALIAVAGVAMASPPPEATIRAEGVSVDLCIEGAPRVGLEAESVEGESSGTLEMTRPRLDVGDDLSLSGEVGAVEVGRGDVVAEGDVTAVLRAKEPLEIRAERFAVDLQEGTGLFVGAVVVTQGTLVLLCERLDVTTEGDEVRSVVASGSVEIRQDDRLARGGRAEFDRATGIVELTDDPYLVQGNVRLRGTRIRFDVEGGEIVCSGCQAVFSGI